MSKKFKSHAAPTTKQKLATLTPDEERAQKLFTLAYTDISPSTTLISSRSDLTPLARTLFFTPKVAIKGSEVTEAQAEHMDEDQLYERFKDERTFIVYGAPITYNESILEAIFNAINQQGQSTSMNQNADDSDETRTEESPPLVESCTFVSNAMNDALRRIAEVVVVDDDAFLYVLDNYNTAAIAIDSDDIIKTTSFGPQYRHGVDKWDHEYGLIRPNFTSLQEQVDLFMSNFDKRTSAELSKARKRPIVDEDGFTLVLGDDRTVEEGEKKFKKQQKQLQKKEKVKEKQRLDGQLAMYKVHEVQQTRKQQQEQHKLEYADKKIINKLKQQRSFNPF